MKISSILILFLALTTNLFSFTKEDYLITEEDLADFDCKSKSGTIHSSIQLEGLYNNYETYKDFIPVPVTKIRLGLVCPSDKGNISYFEYKDEADTKSAHNFITHLIWGGPQPNAHHPQRIYKFKNILVIVSSPGKSELDTNAIIKLLYSEIPEATFKTIKSRLKCSDKAKIDETCMILDALLSREFQDIEEEDFLFGKSILFNDKGEARIQYSTLKINLKNSNPYGIFQHIFPDNDTEKKELEDLIEQQKKGINPKASAGFSEFLNGEILKKFKMKPRMKPKLLYLMYGNGKGVFQIRKVKNMYISIMVNEHIFDNSTAFQFGYFIIPKN